MISGSWVSTYLRTNSSIRLFISSRVEGMMDTSKQYARIEKDCYFFIGG
jgi:hypothetical protein